MFTQGNAVVDRFPLFSLFLPSLASFLHREREEKKPHFPRPLRESDTIGKNGSVGGFSGIIKEFPSLPGNRPTFS